MKEIGEGIVHKKRPTGLIRVSLCLCWSGRQDLNLRPPDPQSGALPGCATPRFAFV